MATRPKTTQTAPRSPAEQSEERLGIPDPNAVASREEYVAAMKQASEESQRQAEILDSAWVDYLRTTRDACMEAETESWAAYREYLKQTDEKSLTAHKRSSETHRKYNRAVIDSWEEAAPQAAATEALYDYYNELLDISISTQREIAKAGEIYSQRTFEISAETHKRILGAERKHVIATQPIFAEVQEATPTGADRSSDQSA
jgi:hypothetical protein